MVNDPVRRAWMEKGGPSVHMSHGSGLIVPAPARFRFRVRPHLILEMPALYLPNRLPPGSRFPDL